MKNQPDIIDRTPQSLVSRHYGSSIDGYLLGSFALFIMYLISNAHIANIDSRKHHKKAGKPHEKIYEMKISKYMLIALLMAWR